SCLDIPWPVHPRWVRLRGRGRTRSPKSPPAPAGQLSARPGQNSHPSLPQSRCPPFFLQLRRSPEAIQIGESVRLNNFNYRSTSIGCVSAPEVAGRLGGRLSAISFQLSVFSFH